MEPGSRRSGAAWEKNFRIIYLFEVADEPDDDALELELVLGRDADRLHGGVRRAQLDVIALGKIFFHRRLAVDERDDGLAGHGARLAPDDHEGARHDAFLAHRFAFNFERAALLVAEREVEKVFLRARLDRLAGGDDAEHRDARRPLELGDGDLHDAGDAPRAALVARDGDPRGAEAGGQLGLREPQLVAADALQLIRLHVTNGYNSNGSPSRVNANF